METSKSNKNGLNSKCSHLQSNALYYRRYKKKNEPLNKKSESLTEKSVRVNFYSDFCLIYAIKNMDFQRQSLTLILNSQR